MQTTGQDRITKSLTSFVFLTILLGVFILATAYILRKQVDVLSAAVRNVQETEKLNARLNRSIIDLKNNPKEIPGQMGLIEKQAREWLAVTESLEIGSRLNEIIDIASAAGNTKPKELGQIVNTIQNSSAAAIKMSYDSIEKTLTRTDRTTGTLLYIAVAIAVLIGGGVTFATIQQANYARNALYRIVSLEAAAVLGDASHADNRKYVEKRLKESFVRAKDENIPSTLLMFRVTNADSTGDTDRYSIVLRSLATRLKQSANLDAVHTYDFRDFVAIAHKPGEKSRAVAVKIKKLLEKEIRVHFDEKGMSAGWFMRSFGKMICRGRHKVEYLRFKPEICTAGVIETDDLNKIPRMIEQTKNLLDNAMLDHTITIEEFQG